MSSQPSRPERPSDAPPAIGLAFAAAASTLPYEAMFLASPLPASVSCFNDGRLIAVNDAWLALHGWERASVIGRTSVELGFWPAQAQRQAFVDAVGSPGATQHRQLLRLVGGAEYSVRLHGVRIETEPEPLLPIFFVEAKREVDAQRARERSEAALKEANRALEHRLELHSAHEKMARVGHWTNAADEDKVIWSDGLHEITGIPCQGELHRSHGREGIHPDDLADWLAARDAKDGREVELRWTRPDGAQRWFRTRIGQTAVAGNPQTDFGVVQDITAEREARDRLAEQLALLQNIAARVPGMMYRAQLRPDGRSVISYVNDRARDAGSGACGVAERCTFAVQACASRRHGGGAALAGSFGQEFERLAPNLPRWPLGRPNPLVQRGGGAAGRG